VVPECALVQGARPHWQLIAALAELGQADQAVARYRQRLAEAPAEPRWYRFLARTTAMPSPRTGPDANSGASRHTPDSLRTAAVPRRTAAVRVGQLLLPLLALLALLALLGHVDHPASRPGQVNEMLTRRQRIIDRDLVSNKL
jgi:hypothetical protein